MVVLVYHLSDQNIYYYRPGNVGFLLQLIRTMLNVLYLIEVDEQGVVYYGYKETNVLESLTSSTIPCRDTCQDSYLV